MMAGYNEVRRSQLRKEADRWIEKEMAARMAAAEEEMEAQAGASSGILIDSTTQKHVRDATRFAEQGVRLELEIEAEAWVERKLLEEAAREQEDADNPCAGCRGCSG